MYIMKFYSVTSYESFKKTNKSGNYCVKKPRLIKINIKLSINFGFQILSFCLSLTLSLSLTRTFEEWVVKGIRTCIA